MHQPPLAAEAQEPATIGSMPGRWHGIVALGSYCGRVCYGVRFDHDRVREASIC